MKKAGWLYFLLVAELLFSSCQTGETGSYSIKDFDRSLRPFLTKAVSTGIVGYDSAARYILSHAKDDELNLLSSSEHPILRAMALREILRRPGFDHFNVIMHHLDDTAIVATDAGEWGVRFYTISDYMVEHGRWKTIHDKNWTIDEIITKHDYLRSAYTALPGVQVQAKYYPYIKEMALRERVFEERENALYALAKFKKKEDIPVIKDILLSHKAELGSFALVEDFPDTSYMEILKAYYPRRFYRSVCPNQNIDLASSYFKAVASYKSDSSARILSALLDRKPFMPCAIDTAYLKDELIHSIWDNPCPAYSKLRAQIKEYMEKDKKSEAVDLPPLEFAEPPKDTVLEPVYWW